MSYSSICHSDGDVIHVRDCVLVKSGMRKKDIPYVAKIYGFWNHADTGRADSHSFFTTALFGFFLDSNNDFDSVILCC